MKTLLKFAFILAMLSLVSCSKDDDDPINQIDNPTSYTFERNGTSTVSFSGQSTRIAMGEELVSSLLDFSQNSTSLLEMYANETASGGDANPFSDANLNASTKSIKSKVAASTDFFASNTAESATIKADFENWITAQVEEVFPNQNTLAEIGVAGQIADGSSARYVNTKGLEYNQAVGKGLIGALMVDQMLNNYLSPAVLDAGSNVEDNDAGTTAEAEVYTNMEHKWDEAYGYLFGASANPANPIPDLGEDSFLNKYLQRAEGDPDFSGIASDIWEALKLGRAAIVAKNYDVRDQQAEIIRELVSKVIGIRAVYYLQQGKNALPTAGNDYGTAFHDLSEGYGFIYSLRFLRKPNSSEAYFSRTEVDGYLDQLMTGNGFWEVTPATLDSISEEIAAKFDFTVAQAAE